MNVTPDELGRLKIAIDFIVSEDIPKGTVGDNILDDKDWQKIMETLYIAGYEIKRRE